MPIVTTRHYEPEISEIKSESDLVELLQDVRSDVSHFRNSRDYSFGDKSLLEVYEIVQSGKLRFEQEQGVAVEVFDFGNLVGMINGQYNFYAGDGCMSCTRCKKVQVEFEEGWYCKVHDSNQGMEKKSGISPKIQKYLAKGCDDFARKFRPIEEVLKEADPRPRVVRTS